MEVHSLSDRGRILDNPEDELNHRQYNLASPDPLLVKKDEEIELLRGMLKTCQLNYREQEDEYIKLVEYVEMLNAPGPTWKEELGDNVMIPTQSPNDVEVRNLEDKLTDAKTRLKQVQTREVEVKKKLDLAAEATQQNVLDKIQELKMGEKVVKGKLRILEKDYSEIKHEKVVLEKRVKELEGEKWTVELRARQAEQDKERATRRKKINSILNTSPSLRGSSQTDTRPKTVERSSVAGTRQSSGRVSLTNITARQDASYSNTNPKNRMVTANRTFPRAQLTSAAPKSANRTGFMPMPPAGPRQRCVLCGEPFPTQSPMGPLLDTHCHIHHHTFKEGKWGCCSSTYDSYGCLRVPHLRIEFCSHNQVLLTDGTVRTMALN